MENNGESKFSYLLIGLGLGTVAGLIAGLLVHKETRKVIRERGGKSLDYLNQQAAKLRQTADVIVQQGKKLMACKGAESVDSSMEAERQASQEDRQDNPGV